MKTPVNLPPYLIAAVLLLLTLFISGCVTSIEKYQAIDPNQKTITVPAGSFGLLGLLKSSLARDGWKMVVHNGETLTEGTVGRTVSLKTYDNPNKTRYLLKVNQGQEAIVISNESAWYSYDISVVDTLTGSEVLTYSGQGYGGGIALKFEEAMR